MVLFHSHTKTVKDCSMHVYIYFRRHVLIERDESNGKSFAAQGGSGDEHPSQPSAEDDPPAQFLDLGSHISTDAMELQNKYIYEVRQHINLTLL